MSIKKSLTSSFIGFISGQLMVWMKNGNDPKDFKADFRWSIMKPHHAKWIVKALDCVTERIIRSSWAQVGLPPSDWVEGEDVEDDVHGMDEDVDEDSDNSDRETDEVLDADDEVNVVGNEL